MSEARATAHIDGACHPNPGPGGRAAIVRVDPGNGGAVSQRIFVSGESCDTTNIRQVMKAAIEALSYCPPGVRVEIVTNVEMFGRCALDWLPQWKANGWTAWDGKPVKNRDLWEAIDALSEGREVTWKRVARDGGTALLAEAGRLAKEEAHRRKRPQVG